MTMTPQQRDNIKQSVRLGASIFTGWMLVIGLVVPTLINTMTTETWIAIPLFERQVLLVISGIMMCAVSYGLVVRALRRWGNQAHNLAEFLLIVLNSALMLTGGFLLVSAFAQRV